MEEITTFITHHQALALAAIVLIVLVTVVELFRAKRKIAAISTLEATHLMNRENAVVIDIRPSASYHQGHIIDAQRMEVKELQENGKKLEKFKKRPIIIVCQNGVLSQKIAAELVNRNYKAYSIKGGMQGWGDEQMPIIKDVKK